MLLEDFSGRTILVTGGAGFIGSRTVDLLLEHGAAEILVVDDMIRGRPENLRRALASGRVRLIRGDICNAGLMRDLVAGADTVFHLAALRITQCAAEPREAMQVMVDATYELLSQCVSAGVRKVVMASSASVYGMATRFPTTETHHPYDNRTLYGAAKLFGEGLLRSFNDMYGLDYVALRYFNVYGPRMDIHGRYTEVLIRWMERLEEGLPPVIFGDGSETMDLVHVDDVARANVLAGLSAASDVVLNVGAGKETSLVALARLIAEAMGCAELTPVRQPARAINPVARRVADVRRAARIIGFKAEVPLQEGLAGLASWWRAERLGAGVKEPAA